MKIALATHGTLGDFQPMLALSIGFKERGHQPVLFGPPEYASLAAAHGASFHAVGLSVREWAKTVPDPSMHMFSASFALTRHVQAQMVLQMDRLSEMISGYDLVLAASLMTGAATAAELHGIPYRFVAFCPQMNPSGEYPGFFIRSHRLPRFLNRLTWSMGELGWNRTMRAPLNRERKRRGLPQCTNFTRYWLGNHLIVASDRVLGVCPPDAFIPFTQTGYMHLNRSDELPAEVEEFLQKTPVVYVGFGSMVSEDPAGTTRLILNAVRAAGARVILGRGWAGFDAEASDCLVADDLPHAKLFPRVSAVVHHGGSGTTAAAAHAGVPQVIVPHITDQYYWANRIAKLGIGPATIWRRRLTQDRLAAAIRECLSNEEMQRRAIDVASAIHKTDPLDETINAICNSIS